MAVIATAPRTINTGLGAFFILGVRTLQANLLRDLRCDHPPEPSK